MDNFICRVLSIQRRKKTTFVYVSGFLPANQLTVDNSLLKDNPIAVMSIIKGQCEPGSNDKGEPIYRILKISSVVNSEACRAYHTNFTNRAVRLRLCKADILNRVEGYLRSRQFQSVNSPFTLPYRGTSIAAPLKISGRYVERYCKITHEFGLKKVMAENLMPVYEIGYVARDMYSTVSSLFEYSVLEFVSPIHDMDFITEFINKFIEIAITSAKAFQVNYNAPENIQTVVLDSDGCFNGKSFEQLKTEKKNAIFINSPVNSPLVKTVNGKRTETIWIYNGESMAHGYRDENDYRALLELSESQMETLRRTGIEAEYSKDFLSLMKLGIPESVSIGFGIDRFFRYFFGFENMSSYQNIMCHSGEY